MSTPTPSTQPSISLRASSSPHAGSPIDLGSCRITHRSGRVLDSIRQELAAERASAAQRLLEQSSGGRVIPVPKLVEPLTGSKDPRPSQVTPEPSPAPSTERDAHGDSVVTRLGQKVRAYRITISAVAVAMTLSIGAGAMWFLSKGQSKLKPLSNAGGKNSGAEVAKAIPTLPKTSTVETNTTEQQAKRVALPPNTPASSDETTSRGLTENTSVPTTPPPLTPAPPTPHKNQAPRAPTTTTQSAPQKATTPLETVRKAIIISNDEDRVQSLNSMINSYIREGERLAAKKTHRSSMGAAAWESLVWDEAAVSAAKEGVNLKAIVERRNKLRAGDSPGTTRATATTDPQVPLRTLLPTPSVQQLPTVPRAERILADARLPLIGVFDSVTVHTYDKDGRQIAKAERLGLLGLPLFKIVRSQSPTNPRKSTISYFSILGLDRFGWSLRDRTKREPEAYRAKDSLDGSHLKRVFRPWGKKATQEVLERH